MAPKGDSPETAELIELFKSIGLTQSKAAEAAKSAKSAVTLKDIIERHGLVQRDIEEKQAVLLASLAVQGSKLGEAERDYAVSAILDSRLKSTDQVSGASACLLASVHVDHSVSQLPLSISRCTPILSIPRTSTSSVA